jgi:hypothetical protein
MAWMSESFKQDKRFLKLQFKRGKIKRKDVEEIQATLHDVSDKAEFMQVNSSTSQEERPPEKTNEVDE